MYLWLHIIVKLSKWGSYLHNSNILHHFWSKFVFLNHRPPSRVTIYNLSPYSLAINFEWILSWFVLNVFSWIFRIVKLSKFASYLPSTNIWGHFWKEFGGLTHWRDPIWAYLLLCGNYFWRNTTILHLKCLLWLVFTVKLSKFGSYMH